MISFNVAGEQRDLHLGSRARQIPLRREFNQRARAPERQSKNNCNSISDAWDRASLTTDVRTRSARAEVSAPVTLPRVFFFAFSLFACLFVRQ